MNDYFDWLYEIVCYNNPYYHKLLRMLFEIDFYWSMDNDLNRADEGLSLREEFVNQYRCYNEDFDCDFFNNSCSVLEMLIALATKIDDELMWNPDKGDRTSVWFWEMIDNLGLGNLDDDEFISCFSNEVVEENLDIFMGRKYNTNGFGGLFPIQKCNKNLRKLDIWKQANVYFLKKYGVEEDFEG